jgi:hypothetical protein
VITTNESCTRDIKSKIAIAKAALNKNTGLKVKEKCYIWSTALTSESRSEYLETSEMWRLRRMEKIGWTDL